MTDHVSGEKFEAWLTADGLVRFEWAEGAALTPTDAQQALDAIAALHDNVAGPVLVDLRTFSSVERKARRMFAATPAVTRQALLVDSPLSRTIGNFFLTLNRPAMPVKLFDDEAEAIVWLHDDR